VVPRDLATENGAFFTHPALEERMTDAVHQRRSAVLRDGVLDGVARAHVVDDLRPGMLEKKRLGQERGHEIARDELAGPVDEAAAIGVAAPRDADVRSVLRPLLDDVPAVLLDERVCLVRGERAVDVEAQRSDATGESLE